MLPLKRSDSLCVCQADPAISLIGISFQQAPAVLLIHDGIHTDRNISPACIRGARTLTIVQVVNGYLHKVRREAFLHCRIYLIAAIIKGGVAEAIDRAFCLYVVAHILDCGLDVESIKPELAAMPRTLKALKA